jgi:predicted amino acid dehydrogenase
MAMFCSVNSQAFYVANTLVSNDWNYESKSGAGIFGLGAYSPVWNMTNLNKTDVQYLSVQFQNVTDWSFYTPGYTPSVPGN